jgi:hypothetical protein
MKPLTAADPETKSADLLAGNVARLKELFPEAFTEGKIDFDTLKQLLDETLDEREEKYGLNWHGKRRARQIALTPSVHNIGAGTLLVCLAPQITREQIEPLALGMADWHKTQAPAGESTVVFRDSAFTDDVAKTNLAAILQQHGLENVRSL